MRLMIIRGGGLKRQSLMTARFNSEVQLDIIEGKIIRSLGEKPGSSIGEIARELMVNRSTASKYLHVLRAKRRVSFRQIGPVKLWSLEVSKSGD